MHLSKLTEIYNTSSELFNFLKNHLGNWGISEWNKECDKRSNCITNVGTSF
jgi:hypothetical protein